ncbi:hypothetical protein, partial [Megasphaera sp. UBA4233]
DSYILTNSQEFVKHFFELLLRGGREPSRPLNSLFSISHSPLLVKGFFYTAKKKAPAGVRFRRLQVLRDI